MSTVQTRRCTACAKRTQPEGQCHRCGAFPGDLVPQLDQSIGQIFPHANPWLDGSKMLGMGERICEALRPFALMHRADSDPSELACARGVASDMTCVMSADFERAFDLLLDLGDPEFVEKIADDDRYAEQLNPISESPF